MYIQLITRPFAVYNSAGVARVRLFLVSWCHRSLLHKCHILLTERGLQANKQLISFWPSHNPSLFIPNFSLGFPLPRDSCMYMSFRIYRILTHIVFPYCSLARKIWRRLFFRFCGMGIVVSKATDYRLEGPGIEFLWGARFSAPVQTGPTILSRWAACGRSPAEIVGSNPTGGMDVCLLWMSCVVR